jgi:hypothetical protein
LIREAKDIVFCGNVFCGTEVFLSFIPLDKGDTRREGVQQRPLNPPRFDFAQRTSLVKGGKRYNSSVMQRSFSVVSPHRGDARRAERSQPPLNPPRFDWLSAPPLLSEAKDITVRDSRVFLCCLPS